MKKILVINPNSSEEMTNDIRSTISYASDSNWSIDVISMPGSPEVLESFSDYTKAGIEIINYFNTFVDSFPYDGVLLACMGDPSLYAVKEECPVPLIGIAEAAISAALLTGFKYSILASSDKAKPMMESMVMTYGQKERLACIESFSIPIEAFMEDKNLLRFSIKDASKRASENGADILILGCAGMTMITDELDDLSDIPIIDPIKAGLEFLKAILNSAFPISRAGLYS